MTSSLAAVPKPILEPTGLYNWYEVFKFTRLCVIWIIFIFVPVWLACWAVGELVPFLIAVNGPGHIPEPVANMIAQVCYALVPLTGVMVFIPINAMFMVLCERRALALFTVRKGPNRVGPDGLFQTAADAVKLLFKEDITPTGADAVMFTLAPIVFFAPSIFGAMPLLAAVTFNHPLFMTMRLPTGIFFVLGMSAIPVVALVMGGWASNNKYSLVGGLRSAAQAISYEIPLVMSIITVCFMCGTLDVWQIAAMQGARKPSAAHDLVTVQSLPPVAVFLPAGTPLPQQLSTVANVVPHAPQSLGLMRWNLFAGVALNRDFESDWSSFVADPAKVVGWSFSHIGNVLAYVGLVVCSILLMCIYLIGACAEINRIPFDLPEAESELVSGYNTEYSGIKFAIFFLAEFTNLFIVATITTVMFLGGGASPIPGFLDPAQFQQLFGWVGSTIINVNGPTNPNNGVILWALGSLLNPVTLSMWFWAVVKVYSIVIFAILVRGTLPRFRIDQLLDFSWKRLIPLSLLLFLLVSFLMEYINVNHA